MELLQEQGLYLMQLVQAQVPEEQALVLEPLEKQAARRVPALLL